MGRARRRIGVLGGTFDPIHLGHLVAACEVRHRLALDELIFVPTGEPWQKQDRQVTAAEDRYIMTLLATDRSTFGVSRVDIDRTGPTFTVDTLRDLHAPARSGGPLLHHRRGHAGRLPTWREPDVLLELAHMVAVTRPGHELDAAPLPPSALTTVEIPGWTSLRPSVVSASRGRAIDYLVPAAVVEYIGKHQLYR